MTGDSLKLQLSRSSISVVQGRRLTAVNKISHSTHYGTQVGRQDVLCRTLQRWSDAEGFQFSFSQVLPPLPPRLREHDLRAPTIRKHHRHVLYSLGIAASLLTVRFLITRTEEIELQTMLSKLRNSFFLLNLIACYRILQRKRRQSHPKTGGSFSEKASASHIKLTESFIAAIFQSPGNLGCRMSVA